MARSVFALLVAGSLLALAGGSTLAADAPTPPRQKWSFSGPFGKFDRGQLQRGFKVYKEVCQVCHGLKYVAFRSTFVVNQFPTNTGPSPGATATAACCGQKGDRCVPAPTNFASQTWLDLHFSVDDPFYFVYQYTSSGTETSSTLWAITRLPSSRSRDSASPM